MNLGTHDLNRLAVPATKGRAEHLMPPDNFFETPVEHDGIESAGQGHRDRDVVERITGRKLVEEPQPQL
jgi:hypothetical protein